MSPADQPQAHATLRSTDPPSLWLSLVLGSVLIHLVLFILASLFLTRTASVQIDPEPINVEFVDPTAVTARSTQSSRAIAVRTGTPSAVNPSATQVPLSTEQSQPSAVNSPIEQPLIPLPTQQQRLPFRSRQPRSRPPTQPVQPIPTPVSRSAQPQPTSSGTPFPQSVGASPVPGQPQAPSSPAPNPSEGSDQPVRGEQITQLPQGDSVIVTVSNPRQPTVDVQTQAAQPIDDQKSVTVHYSSALAQQTIHLEATLTINQAGQVLGVEKTKLLSSSSGSAIDEATLTDLANQIFTQWRFKPAQDNSGGKLSTPPLSNLIIDAHVQLP